MKEINLETFETVTHATFGKRKINDNVPPTIVEFLSSYKNKKAEVL